VVDTVLLPVHHQVRGIVLDLTVDVNTMMASGEENSGYVGGDARWEVVDEKCLG
jgi:hypothetical protein